MDVILAEQLGGIRRHNDAHAAFLELLRPDEDVAAEGLGSRLGNLAAIDAECLGKDAASMQPLPVADQ